MAAQIETRDCGCVVDRTEWPVQRFQYRCEAHKLVDIEWEKIQTLQQKRDLLQDNLQIHALKYQSSRALEEQPGAVQLLGSFLESQIQILQTQLRYFDP